MRAYETYDQTVNRQEQDKLRQARKRASVTPEQANKDVCCTSEASVCQ